MNNVQLENDDPFRLLDVHCIMYMCGQGRREGRSIGLSISGGRSAGAGVVTSGTF